LRLNLRNAAVADTIRAVAAALQTTHARSCAAAITATRLQIDGTNLNKRPASGKLHGTAAGLLVRHAAYDTHLAIQLYFRLKALNTHTSTLRDVWQRLLTATNVATELERQRCD
jgi:hypothetical protein